MHCLIITFLLILLVLLTLLCIYKLNLLKTKNEHFQYATLFDNNYQNKIDPGFGNKMWELESAPEWDFNDYDLYAKHPQPGDFGKLVSYLEDRNNATAIKNLPV